MTNQIEAWHFVGASLRDDSPIPKNGEKLVFDGELKMCRAGFHASINILDALMYSPGFTCCKVLISGEVIIDTNKLVASERTIIWRVNAENQILKFARECALDVIHLWKAPQIVVDFLNSGDRNIAYAAYAAAYAAANAVYAANAAAYAVYAANDAAYAAANDAAYAAATLNLMNYNDKLTRLIIEAHNELEV
jgi:hypothetical protein